MTREQIFIQLDALLRDLEPEDNGEGACCDPNAVLNIVAEARRMIREFNGRAAEPLTVAELQRESYETARDKGWHEEDDQPPSEAMMWIAAEGLYQSARCRFIEAYRRGERGDEALAGVDPMGTVATLSDRQVRVIAWLALVNTEVAEAIEDVVAGRWGTTKNEKGKPEGLGSELADIIIRVGDDAGALGIDLAAELRAKLDYNRTRSHKHGGKLA